MITIGRMFWILCFPSTLVLTFYDFLHVITVLPGAIGGPRALIVALPRD